MRIVTILRAQKTISPLCFLMLTRLRTSHLLASFSSPEAAVAILGSDQKERASGEENAIGIIHIR